MNSHKWKYLLIPVLLSVLAVLSLRTGWISLPGSTSSLGTPAQLAVTTSPVQQVIKTPKLQLTGALEGLTSVIISAKIPGRIQQVFVEDGAPVAAGVPLLQLESVELSSLLRFAQSTVNKTQVAYDNSVVDFRRYEQLYDQNAISRQQLDSAQTRLAAAEADLSTAQAALTAAREQLGYASITAPIAGYVANKNTAIGQVVSAGLPLMTIEDISYVYAIVNIEQKDIANVVIGQPATVTVDAYPGMSFTGKVALINPVAGSNSRMFRAKLLLPNTDSRLKPGMFIKASIVTGNDVPVAAVPQEAVFQAKGLYYIFVADAGKAIRRQVEVGDIIGNLLEVKSGLNSGDQVITSNATKLKDGDPITLTGR